MVPAKAATVGHVVSKTYIADPTQSPLGTPFLVLISEGEGHATHLGHYTIQFHEVYHMELVGSQLLLVSEGTFVATSANGDQLFGNFSNSRENGGLTFTGHAEFTGGTGRFAGATGSEITDGVIDPNMIDFSYTHDGFISSVGSTRGNKK
jgi:hypothetical protein